jgi:hypothetical protein
VPLPLPPARRAPRLRRRVRPGRDPPLRGARPGGGPGDVPEHRAPLPIRPGLPARLVSGCGFWGRGGRPGNRGRPAPLAVPGRRAVAGVPGAGRVPVHLSADAWEPVCLPARLVPGFRGHGGRPGNRDGRRPLRSPDAVRRPGAVSADAREPFRSSCPSRPWLRLPSRGRCPGNPARRRPLAVPGRRAVAGVPDAGCVPVPRERGRLGAGPAFCPSRLRLRLSGPRMVFRQPGTAGAPGGSGAPCGGRGAGCRACPCTVGADAWEPVRLPARLVRGSGFWAADGVPATGGRWRSRDAVRWPGPPVPLAVPDAVRWPERRMPGGSPCTVGVDAWEPVRCRSLGIRTDSWSPDWDTAATLPGPPVRPPVPVLS